MSLGKHKIELFYDVVSPWSYFAFETLLRYEKVNRRGSTFWNCACLIDFNLFFHDIPLGLELGR